MTLPNLKHVNAHVVADHDRRIEVTVHPDDQQVSICVVSPFGACGITLSAWDADVLAGHLHAAVTESLFDLADVS